MILTNLDLDRVVGRVTMVDGSFDPIHEGHVEYFRQAAQLGDLVLCNIAPDSWTVAKHPVLLERTKRAIVIDAIRFVDFVYLGESSTLEALSDIRPKRYVKGSDWKLRGGIPSDEQALCDELGIDVVYLDTVLNSSTRLINDFRGHGG